MPLVTCSVESLQRQLRVFDALDGAKATGGLTYAGVAKACKLFCEEGKDQHVQVNVTRSDRTSQDSLQDMLDVLVAVRVISRSGSGKDAKYRNTENTSRFLVSTSPTSVSGGLDMFNTRLFRFWADVRCLCDRSRLDIACAACTVGEGDANGSAAGFAL